MDDTLTTKTLLERRKLTRTIGQILSEHLRSYLSTLTPLFRPKLVFGNHVQGGGVAEQSKSADQAFKELQSAYEKVAPQAPFLLPRELASPMMQMTSTLELTPSEYEHVFKHGGTQKKVNVTRPFRYILTYSGYAPRRLQDVMNDLGRSSGELQVYVLHYLAMQVVLQRQPGLMQLFETLHFPIEFGRLDGFGALPVTFVGASIGTRLPSDDLVIESTEMAGMDAFEEIVAVEQIDRLHDPLAARLASARG